MGSETNKSNEEYEGFDKSVFLKPKSKSPPNENSPKEHVKVLSPSAHEEELSPVR